MRNTLFALSAVAAVAMTAPAAAQPEMHYGPVPATTAGVVAGAAVGTAVGVGLYNGWWANSAGLPATAAGAAATGALAGIGTLALIHAATTPCHGVQALLGNFLTSPEGCVNGQWVGYRPMPMRRR